MNLKVVPMINTWTKYILACLTVVIAISLIMPISAYSAMSDSSDRLSSDQSGVFSPGYINATRQRTNEIINQSSKPKSFMESAIEYVKGKLSNDVGEDAANKVTPELKKKTSGTGDSAGKVATATLADTPIESTSLLSADTVQKLIDETMSKGASMTVLKNGTTLQVWTEETTNPNLETGALPDLRTDIIKHSYFSLTNSSGDKIVEMQEFVLQDGYNSSGAYQATDLGDGRFAIVIAGEKPVISSGKYSYSDYVDSIRIYDSGGTIESSKDYFSSRKTGQYVSISDLTSLGDGKLAMNILTYNSRTRRDTETLTITDYGFNTLASSSVDSSAFGNSGYTYGQRFDDIVSLGDGKMAIVMGEVFRDGMYTDTQYSYIKVLDSSLNVLSEEKFYTPAEFMSVGIAEGGLKGTQILDISSFGDGRLSVIMNINNVDFSYDYDANTFNVDGGSSELALKILDSNLNEISSYSLPESWKVEENDYIIDKSGRRVDMNNITVLGNGNIVIPVVEFSDNINGMPFVTLGSGPSETLWVFDGTGNLISNDVTTERGLSSIVSLGGGDFGIIYDQQDTTYDGEDLITISNKFSQQFSSTGSSVIKQDASASTNLILDQNASDAYSLMSSNIYKSIYSDTLSFQEINNSTMSTNLESSVSDATTSIFKGLLKGGSLDTSLLASVQSVAVEGLSKDSLQKYALAAPAVELTMDKTAVMNAAFTLASIMKNPTEDQKLLLDVAVDVMKAGEDAQSPELKKASDDLLQVVASALMAQAIPDLMNAGDVASIKGVFAELNASKERIMSEYYGEVKPYYEEVKKMLLKNMTALQIDNVLSKNMTEKELANLEPSEVDRILEKVRKMGRKSFDEEYILQQEAKYRSQYIDPNKKLMEEKMKLMMQTFTAKLSKALESANVTKK